MALDSKDVAADVGAPAPAAGTEVKSPVSAPAAGNDLSLTMAAGQPGSISTATTAAAAARAGHVAALEGHHMPHFDDGLVMEEEESEGGMMEFKETAAEVGGVCGVVRAPRVCGARVGFVRRSGFSAGISRPHRLPR
jgi:hypothetical protein